VFSSYMFRRVVARSVLLPKAIRGKRVVVTGAGGFIGSHLVEALVAHGANVTAFFRYTSHAGLGCLANSPVRSKIVVYYGDIRDRDSVAEAFGDCEIVFHLAAHIGIPYSYAAPQDFIDVNVTGTANALQAARKMKRPPRVVVVSTSEVYGSAQITPMDETHPLTPQSPYAASKLAAEKLALAFHLSYETPVSIARPFNVFGPRQSPRAIFPTIVTQALESSTVRLGAVDTRRDLTFVSDTVRGLIMCAVAPNAIGQTLNLATGADVSIRELVDEIGAELRKKLRIKEDNRRLRPARSEVMRLVGDATRAKALLGWRPEVTRHKGIRATIKYFKSHRAVDAAEYRV